MLEYVFFEAGIRDKFAAYVRELGIECRLSDDGGLLALLPEDIDETVADAVDHRYEVLLQETAALLGDEVVEESAAGVMVQLSDGTPCQVRLDPDILARMLGCLSMEELQDLVQAIALAVETPDAGPICHAPKERN